MFKKFFKKQKIKLLCENDKHDWEHYTCGNMVVDNLNETYGFWDIGARQCKNCHKNEFNLKDGWAEKNGMFTINDLK